ncbi:MAG: DNA adenine methylase [Halobacteria archaeon]
MISAPLLSYGGKKVMVNHILKYVPSDVRVYCEPFVGAGWVFFNKPVSPVEIINDVNPNIVAFYKCLKYDDLYYKLSRLLYWTPYSEFHFNIAYDLIYDDELDVVTRAWAYYVFNKTTYSGICDDAFCSDCNKRVAFNRKRFDKFRIRLKNTDILCDDALHLIPSIDADDVLFYLDPPYILSSLRRQDRFNYQYGMSDDQHAKLFELLLKLKGMCIFSHYHSDLYDGLLNYGWKKFSYSVVSGMTWKTKWSDEVLWINKPLQERIGLGSDLLNYSSAVL